MALLPITELEAVNVLLAGIGEAPVNSLETGLVDAVIALSTLRDTSRTVQTTGWHFNTETRTLTPTVADGFLYVPANTASADTVDEDEDTNISLRGLRLYNLDDNTFAFEDSLKVRLVLLLAFDELTQDARTYITFTALTHFQQDRVGSATLSDFQGRRMQQAWVGMRRANTRAGDYNVLRDNSHASRLLNRRPGAWWR